MSTNKKNNNSDGAGMFLIISLFFLGISVYQTAKGYTQMFKGAAWIMSIGIGIMMLFLAFEMRKRKKRGEKTLGLLMGYFVLAIFSFIGNFNALYTNYYTDSLYETELSNHQRELTEISTYAIEALKNADPISLKLKNDVDGLKEQLKTQITNTSDPGIGRKAKVIISDIESALGKELTYLKGNPKQQAKMYADNIDQLLNTKLKGSKLFKANELISTIELMKSEIEPQILEVLSSDNILKEGEEINRKAMTTINNIGAKTENFLGKSKFKYDKATFTNQDMNKISHSFRSAFSNSDNKWAAIIIVIAAIFIDAVVPFVVFVSTRKEEDDEEEEENKEEENTTGPRITVIN